MATDENAVVFYIEKRDFHQEINDLITRETQGEYDPRVVAHRLTEYLEDKDPFLLEGWLYSSAEGFLYHLILQREGNIRRATRQKRQTSRRTQSRREKLAESLRQRRSDWMNLPVTTEGGMRKPLSKMTADDLVFSINTYRSLSASNGRMADFFTAVHRQIGDRLTVEESLSEEELSSIWDSIRSE